MRKKCKRNMDSPSISKRRYVGYQHRRPNGATLWLEGAKYYTTRYNARVAGPTRALPPMHDKKKICRREKTPRRLVEGARK